MINTAVKSEFIEIGAEGLTFDKIDVEIPYVNSDGRELEYCAMMKLFATGMNSPYQRPIKFKGALFCYRVEYL